MSTITQWEGVFTHVDENGNKQQMFPEIKTDPTLTLGGKAADAAVTGAMIKKATPVKILKADFEALTEEQKNTGSYLIIDAGLEFPEGGSGASSAAEVSYDGSETGLGSNVQEAIDNVDSKLTAGDLKFQFATDGEGNYGYLGADGSLIPFKKDVDLETLTAATALASDITIGCTAWVNGVLITGTRPAPLKSLTGSFEIFFKGSKNQTVDVVFEEKFDELPTVTGSPSYASNGSHVSSISIYNVTTSGFTVTLYGDGDGSQGITGTYYWTARV